MNQLTTTINKPELATLCADAISELERAVRSFPTWPDALLYSSTEEYEQRLTITRALNDHGRETGVTIFEEEFLEFLVIASKGNRKWARIELVQAMAMLLRIYCHLDAYVSHGATEGTEKEPTMLLNCPHCGRQPGTSHKSNCTDGACIGYAFACNGYTVISRTGAVAPMHHTVVQTKFHPEKVDALREWNQICHDMMGLDRKQPEVQP
jgi:hypothetical protein